MNKFFLHLFDTIGGKLVRQLLRDHHKQSLSKEAQLREEEIRQQKLIQKVNYYNYLSIFYFLHLNRVKVFLTSTIFLDYLIFLVPKYDLLINLTATINFEKVFLYSAYILVFIMLWEISVKLSKQKKHSLVSSKGLLLIILILILFATIFQILLSQNGEISPIKFFLKVILMLAACGPILISIFKASKNKNRPNINNLILIINYILPIILLRTIHFIATISIFILGQSIIEYLVFSIVLIIVLVQKRPLVERIFAAQKRTSLQKT